MWSLTKLEVIVNIPTNNFTYMGKGTPDFDFFEQMKRPFVFPGGTAMTVVPHLDGPEASIVVLPKNSPLHRRQLDMIRTDFHGWLAAALGDGAADKYKKF